VSCLESGCEVIRATVECKESVEGRTERCGGRRD
jgi:hypothetical protein